MEKQVEQFWEEMPANDRIRLLEENHLWQGVNTYFWKYLPNQVQIIVEEEFNKSRR